MPSARLQHRDVGIGIDANVGGDQQTALDDFLRREVCILDERARRGEGVAAAGANGQDAVIRLDYVTGAGDDEAVLPVGYGEQCLEPSQNAVASPILGELHRCPLKISRVSLQFLLELLEEGEGVSGGAGESGD